MFYIVEKKQLRFGGEYDFEARKKEGPFFISREYHEPFFSNGELLSKESIVKVSGSKGELIYWIWTGDLVPVEVKVEEDGDWE